MLGPAFLAVFDGLGEVSSMKSLFLLKKFKKGVDDIKVGLYYAHHSTT